jgi:pimeloyl-ACP methyl ester carboxylesterase
MKNIQFRLLALIVMYCISAVHVLAQARKINNVVLVHGAFVDGSGWKPVFDILVKKGYHVSVVQQTLTSFESDIAATNRVLDQQSGPCILVGHSYGGAIITEAGINPHVAGLVYIAAHAPDKGENEADLGKKTPAAYKSLKKGSDGIDAIEPAKFFEDFAADVDPATANFMAFSQPPTYDNIFHGMIKNAAWRTKPSWYMVAGADKIINPDLERMYAKRAKSYTVEVKGASHAVFLSRPKEVAALIIKATENAENKAR